MARALLALAFLLEFTNAAAEEIVNLQTRSGVTQSYLLSAPDTGKPSAIAILFPGGLGKTDLHREVSREQLDRGNFLVRTRRLFAGAGIVTAVVDAPSDQPGGMEDDFRLGSTHTDDISKVVADVKTRFPGLPVFLVGTSRGTISAAAAGARLSKEVDGIVLTATLFLPAARRPGLSGFDFSTIPSPVLFVHHVSDGCTYTPYSSAKRLAERFPLVSVSGGSPAQSKPCEAMSEHGFLGREGPTVDAITKWMTKQPYPREIN